MHPDELDPRALVVLVLLLCMVYGARAFSAWREQARRERVRALSRFCRL